jgi:flagellum-specific ATP synthase
MMIQAGLYVQGSDRAVDRAIRLWPLLDAFLAEEAPDRRPGPALPVYRPA